MEHTDILPSRKSSWKNDAWKTSDVFLGIRPIFMEKKPLVVLGEDRKFLQPNKKSEVWTSCGIKSLALYSIWERSCTAWSRTRCSGWRSPQSRLSLGATLYRWRPKRSFLSSLCFELLVQLFCDHPRSCCPSRAWWADLNTWPKDSVFWDWSKPDGNLRIPPNANPHD